MTYDEAKELMDKHMNLIVTESKLDLFPYKIKYLLIAPKDKSFSDRMEVFKETFSTPNDNEGALKKLGFLKNNLEVYILGEKNLKNDEYCEYVLYNYLSETDQLK